MRIVGEPQRTMSSEQARYLANPNLCPVCWRGDTSAKSGIEWDNGGDDPEVWQEVSCDHCHSEWVDIYLLSSFRITQESRESKETV